MNVWDYLKKDTDSRSHFAHQANQVTLIMRFLLLRDRCRHVQLVCLVIRVTVQFATPDVAQLMAQLPTIKIVIS